MKFMLRKWKSKTLFHAKIYHLRDLMTKFLKKEPFKQNKAIIEDQIYKKQTFIDEIDLRKKEQFFCEWARFVNHKRTLQKAKGSYIQEKKVKLKAKFLKIWLYKLSHIKSDEYKLNKAENYRKSRTIINVLNAWRRLSYVQTLPEEFQRVKNVDTKRNCFMALRNFKDEKKLLRSKQKHLENKLRSKLLKKYFVEYRK